MPTSVRAALVLASGASNLSDPLLRSSQRMAHDSLMKTPTHAPDAMVMMPSTTKTLAMTSLPATLRDCPRIPGNQTSQVGPGNWTIRLLGTIQGVPV